MKSSALKYYLHIFSFSFEYAQHSVSIAFKMLSTSIWLVIHLNMGEDKHISYISSTSSPWLFKLLHSYNTVKSSEHILVNGSFSIRFIHFLGSLNIRSVVIWSSPFWCGLCVCVCFKAGCLLDTMLVVLITGSLQG